MLHLLLKKGLSPPCFVSTVETEARSARTLKKEYKHYWKMAVQLV
jgi:hypothetical protein